MNIEEDNLAKNYFRLLWLIHADDETKLGDGASLYGWLTLIKRFLEAPETISARTLLMEDQICDQRFPMLIKGMSLMMWYESSYFKKEDSGSPYIPTKSPISRYLSTLAHIYSYFAVDKIQSNLDVCRRIRRLVSKYRITAPIIEEVYCDMGSTPMSLPPKFHYIMNTNGFSFAYMNFFGLLASKPELSKKVRNICIETMYDDLDCDVYFGYGLPYFMVLHLQNVYAIHEMWQDAADHIFVYDNIRVFDPQWTREEVVNR